MIWRKNWMFHQTFCFFFFICTSVSVLFIYLRRLLLSLVVLHSIVHLHSHHLWRAPGFTCEWANIFPCRWTWIYWFNPHKVQEIFWTLKLNRALVIDSNCWVRMVWFMTKKCINIYSGQRKHTNTTCSVTEKLLFCVNFLAFQVVSSSKIKVMSVYELQGFFSCSKFQRLNFVRDVWFSLPTAPIESVGCFSSLGLLLASPLLLESPGGKKTEPILRHRLPAVSSYRRSWFGVLPCVLENPEMGMKSKSHNVPRRCVWPCETV